MIFVSVRVSSQVGVESIGVALRFAGMLSPSLVVGVFKFHSCVFSKKKRRGGLIFTCGRTCHSVFPCDVAEFRF